jgi:hypothetical protein
MSRRRTAQDRAALERFEQWLRELGQSNTKLMHRLSQRRVGVDFLLDVIIGLYEREGIELRPWTSVDDLFEKEKVSITELFYDESEDEDDEYES